MGLILVKINDVKVNGIAMTVMLGIGLMLLTIYTFYPGVLTLDSEYQLHQAQTLIFNDWHPPFMALVWSWLNHIYFGPAIMLIFHNLLFWLSLCLFALYIFPQAVWYRCLFIFCFGMLPSVFFLLGFVLKDVGMMASLFFATDLLLYAQHIKVKPKKIILLCIAVVFLFYGFAVRLNSAPAVIVLCVWLISLLFGKKVILSIIGGAVLFGAMFAANHVINERFLHIYHFHPFQQVQLHDLAGISVAKQKLIFPAYVFKEHPFTLKTITKKYSPWCVGYMLFDTHRTVRLSWHTKDIEALNKLWLKTIFENPWFYLQHRIHTFLCLMVSCDSYLGGLDDKKYEKILASPSYIFKFYSNASNLVGVIILFRGWVYVLNCLIVLLMAIRFRKILNDWVSIIYINLSALLYVAGYLIYTPCCEFRYLYWVVIASLVTLTMLIKGIMQFPKDVLPRRKNSIS